MYCSNVRDKEIMQEGYEEEVLNIWSGRWRETIKVHRRSVKAAAALRQGGAMFTPQLPRPLDVPGPLLMRRVHPLSDAGSDGGQRDHCASRAIKSTIRGTVTMT